MLPFLDSNIYSDVFANLNSVSDPNAHSKFNANAKSNSIAHNNVDSVTIAVVKPIEVFEPNYVAEPDANRQRFVYAEFNAKPEPVIDAKF